MITYRLAKPSDYRAIAALHAQSWKENYRGSFLDDYLDHHADADRLEVWSKRMTSTNPNQYVVLAERGDELVGFVCTFLDYHKDYGCYLDNLHTKSGHQGMGIGKRLMHESASYVVKQRPQSELYLWVLEKNQAAKNIYEKLGGVESGKEIFDNPGGGHSMAYRMVWSDPKVLMISGLESLYQPVNCDLYDHFEIAAMHQTSLSIEYIENEKAHRVEGVIKTLKTVNHEEFLVLVGGKIIRLDKVKKLIDSNGATIVDFSESKTDCK